MTLASRRSLRRTLRRRLAGDQIAAELMQRLACPEFNRAWFMLWPKWAT
jgi:hypothetical protein